MITPLDRPATPDGLFLWVMHRFSEEFEDHAILQGGMALRLVDSPRLTTDIDYVFVPYASRNDVREPIAKVLSELGDAAVELAVHSRMLRAELRLDDAAIQIEIHVAAECPSTPMATGGFAGSLGQPSRIVRVMRPDVALSHKIAAWNERRLLRDLYDVYYLSVRMGAAPNPPVLDDRLAQVESRVPAMKGRRRMSRHDLAAELSTAAHSLTDEALHAELGGILPVTELAGLVPRIHAALVGLAERLRHGG
jgi:predicted nucleotidyltransferase component of viral defense system